MPTGVQTHSLYEHEISIVIYDGHLLNVRIIRTFVLFKENTMPLDIRANESRMNI